MELSELYGKTLVEIRRRRTSVELIFDQGYKMIHLRYDGYLFETEIPPLDQKVKRVSMSTSLGIKALELLRYYNLPDRSDYKQIFFEFERNSFKKSELYCVCKRYTLI